MKTVKIQELTAQGRQRQVPPIKVSLDQWERISQSKVGRKRYKLVQEKPPQKSEDK